MKQFRRCLEHPLTKGLDLDDPNTTLLRLQIIKDKPFLKSIYIDWYLILSMYIKNIDKPVIELGSGAGFIREICPDVVTSDIIFMRHIQLVCDAHALPFSNHSLGGIVMTNVLHHFSNPMLFLSEATRCITNGGIIAMIEPWNTLWSRYVYRKLHYEPFDAEGCYWGCERGRPLTNANNALAWIIFSRDLGQFRREFPEWKIINIQPIMPFIYLLSGGVSLRSLLPGWTYKFFRSIEKCLQPYMKHLGMFALIVLKNEK